MKCIKSMIFLLFIFFCECTFTKMFALDFGDMIFYYNGQPIILNINWYEFQKIKGFDWRSSGEIEDDVTKRYGIDFKNIRVLFSNHSLIDIEIKKSGIQTKKNISVGDSFTKVQEKYGKPSIVLEQEGGQKFIYTSDSDRVNIEKYELYFIVNEKSNKVTKMGLVAIPSNKWLSIIDFTIRIGNKSLSLEDDRRTVNMVESMQYIYEKNDWGGDEGFDFHHYFNQDIDLFFTNWGDFITKIVLRNEKLETPRGIKIGDTLEKVIQTYGFNGKSIESQIYETENGKELVYRFLDFEPKEMKGRSYFSNEYNLVFVLKDEIVSGIYFELVTSDV